MHLNSTMLKLTLFAVMLVASGGCAGRAMNYTISSWQNQPIAAAMAAWGAPSEELRIEGKRLLVWNTRDGNLLPPGSKSPAGLPQKNYCTRLLQADTAGTIINGNWEGNDCPGWFSGWMRWF